MSWIEAWDQAGEPTRDMLVALAETRTHWDRLRRSTGRADRAAAEQGVVAAYTAAGLVPPEHIVWCDSPLDMVRRQQAMPLDESGSNVRVAVHETLMRRVGRAVELASPRTFRNRMWLEARASQSGTLARNMRDAIEVGTRSAMQPARSLRSLVLGWLSPRGRQARALSASFSERAFSGYDGPALGIYQCLNRCAPLAEATAPLFGLWQIAANAGWMLPHERMVWLSDRPLVLSVDAQERLHAADGPALRFADGWSYYAWKGVQVPPWLIEHKQLITATTIDRERDPVLRRCMIDIMTPARYIAASDAVCVSRDETGILWLKSWHHWDSWAAVEVVNGTPEPDGSFKHYVLQVPPTMRTAREAVAWTYGLAEHEYARLMLRT